MRKFRSHKLVEAGIITSFDATMFHVFVDAGEMITVPSSFFARGEPIPGDFLVRYADGYLSWSPKKAFKEGYSEEPGRATLAADALKGQDTQEPKSGAS